MSRQLRSPPNESAHRLAIRELIEAYAYCADRRDAKGQMSLFTADTHFVVYMNAKDPKPSQELNSREALGSSLRRSEQVCRHDALPRPEHDSQPDTRQRHRRSVLPGTSPHRRRWKEKPHDRGAPLLRHIREGRRRMVVCGAPAVR